MQGLSRVGRLGVITTLLLSLCLALPAQAGSGFDVGTVPGTPPLGNVNWVAWLNKTVTAGGYPSVIMTEDATNSPAGPNQGYQNFGPVPNPKWIIQVENFMLPSPAHNDAVTMLLGGLSTSSGNIWQYGFNWLQYPEDVDFHAPATLIASDRPCPVMTQGSWVGDQRTINWSGAPGSYHVYRSQNSSGADPDNGLSNGIYFYRQTVTIAGTAGSYVETVAIPSWYIVVPADPGTGAIWGCHSEEGTPTAVTLVRFEASPESSQVHVEWETATELDNLGFNLYRGESATGPWVKLNTTIIPAQQPGLVTGAVYEWLDEAVPPDITVFYRLEDVDIHGVSTFHGPVSITPAGPAAIGLRSFAASSPMAPVVVLGCIILGAALPAGWSLQRRRRTS